MGEFFNHTSSSLVEHPSRMSEEAPKEERHVLTVPGVDDDLVTALDQSKTTRTLMETERHYRLSCRITPSRFALARRPNASSATTNTGAGASWRATVMGSVYHCQYCTVLNLTLSRFAVRRRTMLASGSLLEVAKQPVGPFRQQPSGLVCSLAYRKALGRLRQNPANTELAMYRLSRRLTCHVGDGASQPRHLSLASHIL